MKMKNTAIVLLFALAAPLAHALDASPYVYRTVAEQPQSKSDQEIASLFDHWNAALKTGNAKTVTALYAPDAMLLPTVSNQVRTSPAEIQDYFEHFLAAKPVGQINLREIHRLGPNAAMDSGVYTFTLHDANGATRKVQARYTFVYERINGEWKILDHHSSAMPEAQASL